MDIIIKLFDNEEIYECTSPIFTKNIKIDICSLFDIKDIDIIEVYDDRDDIIYEGSDIICDTFTLKLTKKEQGLKILKELYHSVNKELYKEKNTDIYKLLIDAEIGDINDIMDTIIMHKTIEFVIYALDKKSIKINDHNRQGFTILHFIIESGILSESLEIFNYNPDLNIKSNEGYPPITLCNYKEFIILANMGCDTHINVGKNDEPLLLAMLDWEDITLDEILKLIENNYLDISYEQFKNFIYNTNDIFKLRELFEIKLWEKYDWRDKIYIHGFSDPSKLSINLCDSIDKEFYLYIFYSAAFYKKYDIIEKLGELDKSLFIPDINKHTVEKFINEEYRFCDLEYLYIINYRHLSL